MVATVKFSVKLFAAMALVIYLTNSVLITSDIILSELYRADIIRNAIYRANITDVSNWFEAAEKREETKFIVIHHDAVSQSRFANVPINEITAYHIQKYGVFAYHFYIDAKGNIYRMHSENKVLPHTLSHNYDAVSVCLSGDFNTEIPTEEQQQSMKLLKEYLQMTYPEAVVCGHRDLNGNTDCPGINFNHQNL